MRRNRLGCERRNIIARREREVHLRGAAPEDFRIGEIKADGLLDKIGRRFVGNCEQ